MMKDGSRPKRRTTSGVQTAAYEPRRFAAVLCVGQLDGELVAGLRQRLADRVEIVVARDMLALNEAAIAVQAASFFGVGVSAPLEPLRAFGRARFTWPCAPMMWFGRYGAPTLTRSAPSWTRELEVQTEPYGESVSTQVAHLAARIEKGLTRRYQQASAGRRLACRYGIEERCGPLFEAIALRLPEATWWQHAPRVEASSGLGRFLGRHVYDKIGVNNRADLAAFVLDFEQRSTAESDPGTETMSR